MKRARSRPAPEVFGLFMDPPPPPYLSDAVAALLERGGTEVVPGHTHCMLCEHEARVECEQCHRVRYCGKRCRDEDKRVGLHGAVCEVLQAVGAVEDGAGRLDAGMLEETWHATQGRAGWRDVWDDRLVLPVADVRSKWLASEALSAVLALQEALAREEVKQESVRTIHLVGVERELVDVPLSVWRDCLLHRRHLQQPLELVGVGPEIEACEQSSDEVSLRTECRRYGLKPGDGSTLVMALNPGFSVPDYDWTAALDCVQQWLVSTCHSMEECQVEQALLLERHRLQCVAAWENPWTPLCFHQSGTFSSEVYRKNCVIALYRRAGS